jgi:hypothetical protein
MMTFDAGAATALAPRCMIGRLVSIACLPGSVKPPFPGSGAGCACDPEQDPFVGVRVESDFGYGNAGSRIERNANFPSNGHAGERACGT